MPGIGDADIVLADGTSVSGDFTIEPRWITTWLAIGGMIGTRANAQRLRTMGFTHVLGLQAELDDGRIVAGSGLELHWCPVTDALEPFPDEAVVSAVTFARQLRRRPDQRLYVHCMSGRNRAPLFAWAILRALGVEHELATRRVRAAEPLALLRPAQRRAVERALRLEPSP